MVREVLFLWLTRYSQSAFAFIRKRLLYLEVGNDGETVLEATWAGSSCLNIHC